eukprot:CAMPEP_0184706546 /NCGR_PEP_ID=MMETSP0313-20130426/36815_1 /TAXON_ID=2792 /ORGANISM="Porphyridium aerugineum, Strain SAG 1380-2" /LENGTH=407 /DNA_ID=CAMNT_0027168101 /DNA_START=1 /DNA_END=1224 /DNA_ORIENTATION=-
MKWQTLGLAVAGAVTLTSTSYAIYTYLVKTNSKHDSQGQESESETESETASQILHPILTPKLFRIKSKLYLLRHVDKTNHAEITAAAQMCAEAFVSRPAFRYLLKDIHGTIQVKQNALQWILANNFRMVANKANCLYGVYEVVDETNGDNTKDVPADKNGAEDVDVNEATSQNALSASSLLFTTSHIPVCFFMLIPPGLRLSLYDIFLESNILKIIFKFGPMTFYRLVQIVQTYSTEEHESVCQFRNINDFEWQPLASAVFDHDSDDAKIRQDTEGDASGGVPKTVRINKSTTRFYTLNRMCVIPKYQHQGIGTISLKLVLEHVVTNHPQNIQNNPKHALRYNCLLSTQEHRNVLFYQRLGFRVIHEFDCFGYHNWVMALATPSSFEHASDNGNDHTKQDSGCFGKE